MLCTTLSLSLSLSDCVSLENKTKTHASPFFFYRHTSSSAVMEVFAVQTYFSTEFLAFFETLLQIRRPVLIGKQLVQDASFAERRPSSAAETITLDASENDDICRQQRSESPVSTSAPAAPGTESGSDSGSSAASPAALRGQFDQLRVSHRFKGSTYGELAKEIIKKGAMPLGLYRPAGTKDSTLPYTHVNPGEYELLFPWPAGSDSSASASDRWRASNRQSFRLGERRSEKAPLEGDSVFVLRSKSCPLYGFI